MSFTAAQGDTLTYPTEGQPNVDVAKPFTWSTVHASQGAILVIGTHQFGYDVASTGPLPPS